MFEAVVSLALISCLIRVWTLSISERESLCYKSKEVSAWFKIVLFIWNWAETDLNYLNWRSIVTVTNWTEFNCDWKKLEIQIWNWTELKLKTSELKKTETELTELIFNWNYSTETELNCDKTVIIWTDFNQTETDL